MAFTVAADARCPTAADIGLTQRARLRACQLDSFVVDSPATDRLYTPVAGADARGYRVVYAYRSIRVVYAYGSMWPRWLQRGLARLVHASPSKEAESSSTVVDSDCSPDRRRDCNYPARCETTRCGDQPDVACDDTRPPESCGNKPDELCRSGDVLPPPDKHAEPDHPGTSRSELERMTPAANGCGFCAAAIVRPVHFLIEERKRHAHIHVTSEERTMQRYAVKSAQRSHTIGAL